MTTLNFKQNKRIVEPEKIKKAAVKKSAKKKIDK